MIENYRILNVFLFLSALFFGNHGIDQIYHSLRFPR